MEMNYNSTDRVFSAETFKQFNRLNQNTNSRIPIFFCVDISGSMGERVGLFQTRISLLSNVMKKLLENMKQHPVLSERAVVGIVTYNNKAVLNQTALDMDVVDISEATCFKTGGQTSFSKGLRRTLQAIDQYRDSVRRSDVETFVPIMVFMTDGYPVGDDDGDIAEIYNEIWNRISRNDLYVFPIGISRSANMEYVRELTPQRHGYQIIDAKDFENVFSKIEELVNEKPDLAVEEGVEKTKMASSRKETKDTGTGAYFDAATFNDIMEKIIDRH